jgi:NADH:ubiquinone oxidoreductase subunit 2 (subunit N)
MFFSFYPKISLTLIVAQFLAIFSFLTCKDVSNVLLFCGVSSIVGGTFLAFGQTKLKRLLAFSGVAQIGFIASVVWVTSLSSSLAVGSYLFLYVITTILL